MPCPTHANMTHREHSVTHLHNHSLPITRHFSNNPSFLNHSCLEQVSWAHSDQHLLQKFKRKLLERLSIPTPPIYYSLGTKIGNICTQNYEWECQAWTLIFILFKKLNHRTALADTHTRNDASFVIAASIASIASIAWMLHQLQHSCTAKTRTL